MVVAGEGGSIRKNDRVTLQGDQSLHGAFGVWHPKSMAMVPCWHLLSLYMFYAAHPSP